MPKEIKNREISAGSKKRIRECLFSTPFSNNGGSQSDIIHFILGGIPYTISVVIQIPITVIGIIHSYLGFSIPIPVSYNGLRAGCSKMIVFNHATIPDIVQLPVPILELYTPILAFPSPFQSPATGIQPDPPKLYHLSKPLFHTPFPS